MLSYPILSYPIQYYAYFNLLLLLLGHIQTYPTNSFSHLVTMLMTKPGKRIARLQSESRVCGTRLILICREFGRDDVAWS
jgi:hypothetical protein